MKRVHFFLFAIGFAVLVRVDILCGQNFNPAPYCTGAYTSSVCMQGPGPTNNPSNSVNDFIDFFRTSGGNTNIQNDSSGCNMNPSNSTNFAMYCQHMLGVTAGQTITCTMKSGVTYAQGFSIWVDWNQDNVFQHPGERVAATVGFPAAATWKLTSKDSIIPNRSVGY